MSWTVAGCCRVIALRCVKAVRATHPSFSHLSERAHLCICVCACLQPADVYALSLSHCLSMSLCHCVTVSLCAVSNLELCGRSHHERSILWQFNLSSAARRDRFQSDESEYCRKHELLMRSGWHLHASPMVCDAQLVTAI